MQKVNDKTVYSSLLWNFLERIFVEGIQVVISIVLARILLPKDYGLLALITIFIGVATVFVETGFCSSLINKKELDKKDINFIFTINILVSLLLCLVLFFVSPLIAKFYSEYDAALLVKMLRGYSIILPIGAITSVQTALVHRKMMFKKILFINVIATILSGAIGIYLALKGFGTWALIVQQISFKVILLVILMFVTKWIPKFNFGEKDSWAMIKYGSNILWVRLFNTFYNKLSALLVGKRYSADMLAFYEKGQTFPSMIATNTDYSLQKVMFSAYSKEQDDIDRVRQLMRKTISLISLILFPLMLGMCATTTNIIRCILTDKWLDCGRYMQMFCIFYLLQPIKTTSAQALNGIGRSDVSLKTGIVSKVIGIVSILSTIWFGLEWLLLGLILSEIVACVIYFVINKRYFNYAVKTQLIDILPTFIASLIMAIIVVVFGKFVNVENMYLALALQIVVGIISYVLIILLIDRKKVKILKDFFNKNKKEEK